MPDFSLFKERANFPPPLCVVKGKGKNRVQGHNPTSVPKDGLVREERVERRGSQAWRDESMEKSRMADPEAHPEAHRLSSRVLGLDAKNLAA